MATQPRTSGSAGDSAERGAHFTPRSTGEPHEQTRIRQERCSDRRFGWPAGQPNRASPAAASVGPTTAQSAGGDQVNVAANGVPIGDQYLRGAVLSASLAGLVVSTRNAVTVPVAVPSSALVWRETWTTADSLAAGDDVRVLANIVGQSVVAVQVYANMVQLRGTLSAVDSTGCQLKCMYTGAMHSISVANHTTLPSDPTAVAEGATAFMMAYRPPAGGPLVASWIDVVTLTGAAQQA